MEASEALRRIFWRHRWLLLALAIVPVAIVVPIREHQVPTFAASAHIQGQGLTPDASTQVTAIQSRVTAVATDPGTVGQALTAVHVDRNGTQVAEHEISVTPLGSSAVMVLTVTDRSKPVALSLARSLATVVVNQLNELGTKDDPELIALNQAGAQLTAKRDKLVAELNTANASNQSSTSVQVQSLLAQLSAVEQQLASNQSTVQQIIASLSANTGAVVVGLPVTAIGVSRHATSDGALAGLLGLVIGLLFATIREIIRPTVAQPGAAAGELGTVLLGSAQASKSGLITVADDLAVPLEVTARRRGARTIVLTGPVPAARLAALAERLRDVLPTGTSDGGWVSSLWSPTPMSSLADHVNGSDQGRPEGDGEITRPIPLARGHYPADNGTAQALTVVAMPDVTLDAQMEDPALVVVVPPFAPHSAIDRVADLSVTTNWPILGVIGLRTRRRRAMSRRVAGPVADDREVAVAGDEVAGDEVAGDEAVNRETTHLGAVT